MLENLVELYKSQAWDWRITVAVAVLAPLLFTYIVTLWESTTVMHQKNAPLKRPPTLPYVLPYLGHLPSFGVDGNSLLRAAVAKFGPSTPFKLQMPNLVQWHTSGAEHVQAFFKGKGLSGNLGTIIAMENSFGSPRSSVAFYKADDGGHLPNPKPGSTVRPENRIMYEIHKLVNTNLTGESLIGITSRFQHFFSQQLTETDEVGDEWTEIPDLYAFVQKHMMKAAIISMFGTYILSLNPTFMEDFWAWNPDMGTLFMGIPRWLIPAAYRRRTKVLDNIKRWHKYAHDHFDCTKVHPEDVDWEPYFGSKFSRKRQAMFEKWKQLDDTAKAADDFGFIWAANANAIPAATWFLLELLFDPALEARIHKEFSSALIPPTDPSHVPVFDINKLCSGPLCQSVYAETLRLRVQVMVQRTAVQDIDFCGWAIKKGERISISSVNEALDERVWNTGSESDPHPLDEFWAERFLIYPNDPTSGPLKPREAAETSEKVGERGTPRFSLEGLGTNWIPFSGAPRLCPGRHFAKQEMISGAAIMLAAFEIELMTREKPENDKTYFGFGTLPPKGKIPCRIRRRRRSTKG